MTAEDWNAEDLESWQNRQGLKQVEAARCLGTRPQTYRNWLKGRAKVPGFVKVVCEKDREMTKLKTAISLIRQRSLVPGNVLDALLEEARNLVDQRAEPGIDRQDLDAQDRLDVR